MDGGRHTSFIPPLPPTSEEDRLNWLRLLRSHRVGPVNFYRLLQTYGSAGAALEALPDRAKEAGLHDYAPCPVPVAQREIAQAHKLGVRMLCFGAPDYPTALNDLNAPPPILWARGNHRILSRPALAIVGARNASSIGLRMARDLARDLGDCGYVIVSGMARGTDAAAHRGARDTGTIAVLGGGVDVIYPRENTETYHALCEGGLLLSEQPMGLRPLARHFPPRNRIIAALSRALIVVEAAAKSGSLISARDALDIGREVMAVPGHPLDPRSFGGNALIRDGALLVRHAGDVIDAVGPADHRPLEPPPADVPPIRPDTAPDDITRRVLGLIGASPVGFDALMQDLDVAQDQLSTALSELALAGEIRRVPGNFWVGSR